MLDNGYTIITIIITMLFSPSTSQSSDTAFGITFRKPDGCERKNCTLYWAMGPNNENSMYLDIYMEGDIAGGWMALGFSKNQLMVCNIENGDYSYNY